MEGQSTYLDNSGAGEDAYDGGSRSGYYETDEKSYGGYEDDAGYDGDGSEGKTDLPDFLKQDRQQQAALEAAKQRQFYMTYRQSALFGTLSQGFEQSVGTWNQRFQTLMDMDDSFAKYDKLRSMVSFFVLLAHSLTQIVRRTTLCMQPKHTAASSSRRCACPTRRKQFGRLRWAELQEDKSILCRTSCSSLQWTLKGCTEATHLR